MIFLKDPKIVLLNAVIKGVDSLSTALDQFAADAISLECRQYMEVIQVGTPFLASVGIDTGESTQLIPGLCQYDDLIRWR